MILQLCKNCAREENSIFLPRARTLREKKFIQVSEKEKYSTFSRVIKKKTLYTVFVLVCKSNEKMNTVK